MRERHHSWRWQLPGTPEQLWPMLADTDRFDRDTGVPEVQRLETPEELLRRGHALARVRQYGVPLDYEQLPFEWDEPRRFAVERRFSTGPLASLRIQARLAPCGDGTELVYDVWSRPSGALGVVAIPVQIGMLLARTFDRTFRRYAAIAVEGDLGVATGRGRGPRPAARRRLDDALGQVRAAGVRPALVDRIGRHLVEADELVVGRIRPFELADAWGEPRDEVLDALLEATRAGAVRFRWDVLCPRCRIPKRSSARLGDAHGVVHCDTCLIEWGADLASSVELTFRPTDDVRRVEPAEHCIGGPRAAPHVAAQAVVGPGEVVEVAAAVPGSARSLVVDDAEARPLVRAAAASTGDEASRAVDVGGEATGPAEVEDGAPLRVRNVGDEPVLVKVERSSWGADAVTGSAVLARQRFRDLFAAEALRPGEELDVGSVTIAFTDLCGSTALYREIGDAVAFGRVQSHFDVLRAAIADGGGAVVKTIGDAVMATFPDPASAVSALRAGAAALAELDGPGGPLHLKAGVHRGPAIAVTLNDRVDYFGTTVNLAARLEGLAGPDELVLSDDATDAAVATALGWAVAPQDEVVDHLRGLEGTPVRLRRVGLPTTTRGANATN